MDLSAIAPDASEASEHVRTLRGKSFGSMTPSLSTPESLMGTPPTVAVLFFGGIIVPYDGVKHTIRRSARRARPKLQHTLYESVFPEDCYCESGGTSRLSTGFGCVWGGLVRKRAFTPKAHVVVVVHTTRATSDTYGRWSYCTVAPLNTGTGTGTTCQVAPLMSVQEVYEELQGHLNTKSWYAARNALEKVLRHRQLNQALRPALSVALGGVLRNIQKTTLELIATNGGKLMLEADSWYAEALRLAPDHGEAAAERASLAVDIARAASIATDPDSLKRDDAEVAAIHHRATSLQPANAAAYARLGDWLSHCDQGKHGRLAETTAAYRAAIHLAPNDVPTVVQLGLHQHLRGKSSEAVAAYQLAIALQPSHDEAYALLGTLRYHHDRHLGEAESALRACVQLRSQQREDVNKGSAAGRPGGAAHADFVQTLQLQGRLDEAMHADASSAQPRQSASHEW